MRVADLDFRVHDRSFWPGHAHDFDRTKRLLVKLNRVCSALPDHVWGCAVISLRYCLNCHRLPPMLLWQTTETIAAPFRSKCGRRTNCYNSRDSQSARAETGALSK